MKPSSAAPSVVGSDNGSRGNKSIPKGGKPKAAKSKATSKKRGKPREGMDNEIHNDMFWGFDNV
jgi:hypothetical protein